MWQRWDAEHRPPAPISRRGAAIRRPARPSAEVACGAGRGDAAGAGAAPPGRRRGRARPKAGEIITVTTDLYRAEIDTAGGVIAQVALLAHHDIADEAKPYLALQRTPERIFVAESGLLGEGMPNHRTAYEALPGPRTLAPGADRLEVKLRRRRRTATRSSRR